MPGLPCMTGSLYIMPSQTRWHLPWLAGLAYNQVEGATAGLAYGPGKFAAGYFYATQAVWAGGLGEAIEREIADGCRSITVAGYSLGAAVAQLLAIRIEVRL